MKSKVSRDIIRCSSASFRGNERKYVADCLERGWITQGRYVKELEEKFADIVGARHAIACSSGTAALHLSLLALGAGPSCSVIVPSITYVATANAARYVNADVKFADVNPVDWCMDPDSFMAESTRAFNDGYDVIACPVHMYDALCSIPNTLDATVTIVDSAHAPVANRASVSAHSFYASKVIACGEGGMVVTNGDDLAERVRLYRGQGATYPGRYHHSVIGYNYRMTDLQAAVGLAQLERLEEAITIRRAVVNIYRHLLADSPVTLQGGERASGWMFACLLPAEIDRDTVAAKMLDHGIETRPFFEPLPSLPPYRDHGPVPPVAAEVSKRGICLPTHVELTEHDIKYVCERLLETIEEVR